MPKPHRRKSEPSLFAASSSSQPLAARMRPRSLDEFVGQEHLLAAGKALRTAIERGTIGSMIFWGPPGTGKTTLGRLIAQYTDSEFVPFSAVTEGVPRVREIVAEAEERLERGRATILFVDEIHRFNRAQQDAFLPHVEQGTITLIGATTENPSFEVNGALLSRMRVFVLESLTEGDLVAVIDRALHDAERGLGARNISIADDARSVLARESDGDARRALTALDASATDVGDGGVITVDTVRDALQKRFALHDKSGEAHFNLLSALHKSLRGSDPNAALYWAARMIEGGEDPMTIFRRSIAMAAEDIGVADPQALQLAVAARSAYHVLGPPEGYLPLAEMLVYLATAPKSNSAYRALGAAMDAARETPGEGPPMNI
ncbi:MAG TPA: replication-associated recombination protein A, partial [Gemmatimonadaceae bacterium]|nr:replication-associated recombination protein A [Gemmatimonadaceae bacterium]